MNSTDLAAFNQAVAAAQSGQTQAAHATLTGLNQRYPADANVLLWMAFTSGDWSVANAYIEKVARFEPHNPSLAGARAWLASQQPDMRLDEAAEVIPAVETAGATLNNSSPASYEAVNPNPSPNATLPSSSMDDLSSYNNAATKPKRPWAIIVIAIVVFLLIAGTTAIVLLGASSDSGGVADIPAPPNGQSVHMDNLVQQVFQGTKFQNNASVLKNTAAGYYIVEKGKVSDITSFYSQQMTGKGWTIAKVPNPLSSASGQIYTKGTQAAIIAVTGPLTDQDVTSVPASLKGKFKTGDIVVILLELNKSDFLGTGS